MLGRIQPIKRRLPGGDAADELRDDGPGEHRARRTIAVVREGVEFLVASVRPDGSWPIDTNLSTWVTTLASTPWRRPATWTRSTGRTSCVTGCWASSTKERHPYTGADPGGWALDASARGVPTATTRRGRCSRSMHLDRSANGAVAVARLALDASELGCRDFRTATAAGRPSAAAGARLPFDRSGADLTAHAFAHSGVRGSETLGSYESASPRPALPRPPAAPRRLLAAAVVRQPARPRRRSTRPTAPRRVLAAYRDLGLMRRARAGNAASPGCSPTRTTTAAGAAARDAVERRGDGAGGRGAARRWRRTTPSRTSTRACAWLVERSRPAGCASRRRSASTSPSCGTSRSCTRSSSPSRPSVPPRSDYCRSGQGWRRPDAPPPAAGRPSGLRQP